MRHKLQHLPAILPLTNRLEVFSEADYVPDLSQSVQYLFRVCAYLSAKCVQKGEPTRQKPFSTGEAAFVVVQGGHLKS